jgi:Spy/CpxP family protein refolding chaperone
MRSKRSIYWALSIFLALPFLPASAPAAQYQGGGPGGGQGGGMRGGGQHGPMSPDDRLKQMTKDFNLTADQQAKIKPILVESQKKMDDLRNDSSGDRQAMRSKMMDIQKDANTQIRAQLDDKQKDMFDKQQESMQNRRRGPGGPGGPGGDNSGMGGPPDNN